MMTNILSKSTFLRGNICAKSLWLYKQRRDLIPPTSTGQLFIFDQGQEVGKLAQQLFPGGAHASPKVPFDYHSSIELTGKLISEGKQVIYEAAFQHQGVFAALDILVRMADGWHGYEVKSSTKVHDINITDAALQYWVMAGCSIELRDISIVFINSEYERNGRIEEEQLFKTESVTEKVLLLQNAISQQVSDLKKVVADDKEPEVPIGRQCSNPYECEFKDYCWKEVPEQSILDFTFYRKTEERFKLYHSGIQSIADVEDWQSLRHPYNHIVEAHRNKSFYLESEPLKDFLRKLQYPLYFLDFETVSFALPQFDRSSSYDQMCFLYSLHILCDLDSEPSHREYLASPGKDFREEFLVSLLSDLDKKGNILVWNIGFERSRLNALALLYPQHADLISSVIDRMVDLAIPFQKKWVYDPTLSCSYSIKNVLPFVAPELSYKDMAVNNGQVASTVFQQMMNQSHRDWSVERAHLLEYCKLDTWAMVVIHRYLHNLV